MATVTYTAKRKLWRGQNLVINGSGEAGNTSGWAAPVTLDVDDYYSPPYSLHFEGGGTRNQSRTHAVPIDIRYPYEFSLALKTAIPGRTVTVWIVCEDEISLLTGQGTALRDRGNWDPERNTTLAEPASAGATTIRINAPEVEWISLPNPNAMVLINVPEGQSPDPTEVATEGHVMTSVTDLGGGVWEIGLASQLLAAWPAGTLVSNGIRSAQANNPILFGGLIIPGADWSVASAVQFGVDSLGGIAPTGVRTTFRRGTKWVRWAFSGVLGDDSFWIDDVTTVQMHAAGETYSLEFRLANLDAERRVRKYEQRADSGASETWYVSADDLHMIRTDWIMPGDQSLWEEFLASVEGGEVFTFDPYGTIDNPVAPRQVVLVGDSFRPRRVGQTGRVYYDLTLREI